MVIIKQSSNQDYQISIDTMHLIAKLTDEEKQFIYDRFNFRRGNKYYRHTLHLDNINVRINLSPKKAECHKNFNATIHLHKEFFTSDIPEVLQEIIKEIEWSVNRLDIAFDFKTDKQDSILFKHDKRLKDSKRQYSNETYYLGHSKEEPEYKTKKSIIHYDRNVKQRKLNSPITRLFGNRLEPRLKFPMKDMKLHSMNHDMIMKELKRYRFISDIDSMKTKKWNRNYIREMQQDYDQFLSYPLKRQRAIRKLLKENREPLEQIYDKHRAELFSFLPSNQVTEQTAPEPLETVSNQSLGQFMQRHSTAGKRYLYVREGGAYARVS